MMKIDSWYELRWRIADNGDDGIRPEWNIVYNEYYEGEAVAVKFDNITDACARINSINDEFPGRRYAIVHYTAKVIEVGDTAYINESMKEFV